MHGEEWYRLIYEHGLPIATNLSADLLPLVGLHAFSHQAWSAVHRVALAGGAASAASVVSHRGPFLYGHFVDAGGWSCSVVYVIGS